MSPSTGGTKSPTSREPASACRDRARCRIRQRSGRRRWHRVRHRHRRYGICRPETSLRARRNLLDLIRIRHGNFLWCRSWFRRRSALRLLIRPRLRLGWWRRHVGLGQVRYIRRWFFRIGHGASPLVSSRRNPSRDLMFRKTDHRSAWQAMVAPACLSTGALFWNAGIARLFQQSWRSSPVGSTLPVRCVPSFRIGPVRARGKGDRGLQPASAGMNAKARMWDVIDILVPMHRPFESVTIPAGRSTAMSSKPSTSPSSGKLAL